jgi:hypothetical protein
MTERKQELLSLCSLAIQTWDVRRVIHPPQQLNGLGLRITKLPKWVGAGSLPHPDRPIDVCETVHCRPKPFYECGACRDDGQGEALVNVSFGLCGVIAIRVYKDRAVAIDAASKEIGEISVRNRQRTQREDTRSAHRLAVAGATTPVQSFIRFEPPARADQAPEVSLTTHGVSPTLGLPIRCPHRAASIVTIGESAWTTRRSVNGCRSCSHPAGSPVTIR